jgi:hypothetical protein
MLEASQYPTSNYSNKNRPIAIKAAWHWHKKRCEDQWNRIEALDINPHRYIHLIFDKGAKNTRWRRERMFSKCCLEKW